jgi:hypothetical protein
MSVAQERKRSVQSRVDCVEADANGVEPALWQDDQPRGRGRAGDANAHQ